MTDIVLATLFTLSFSATILLLIKNRLLSEKIQQLTTRDPVTDLKNQAATLNQLEQSFELAKRYSLPLTLALVQIPDLNNLQKRFGNDLTTEYLVDCSKILKQLVRSTDLLGRVEFDSFLIALTNTNTHDSRAVFERLINSMSHLTVNGIAVSVNVGASHISANTETLAQLTKLAEDALKRAKAVGNNAIEYLGS